MSDSNAYRPKNEERVWGNRDPVIMLRDRLTEAGEITIEDFKNMDNEILEEIEQKIIKFADESPEPSMDLLDKYVLVENDSHPRRACNRRWAIPCDRLR